MSEIAVGTIAAVVVLDGVPNVICGEKFLARKLPSEFAYGRLPVRAPRQFVNFGTTNAEFFLKDPTGARRFWPVRVGDLKIEQLVADRDQLWAEVVLREAKGESIHLPEALWQTAATVQELHRERHPWEDELETKLALDKAIVTVDATWQAVGLALDASRRDNRAARIITETMTRHGFIGKKQVRVRMPDGKSCVFFCWVKDMDQAGVDFKDIESGVVNPFVAP